MTIAKDKGFQPELAAQLNVRGQSMFETWGMQTRGVPIATDELNHGAVWYGNKFNERDESLALVFVNMRGRELPIAFTLGAKYFFGAFTRKAIETASPEDIPNIAADAAMNTWTIPDEKVTAPLKGLVEVLIDYAALPKSA